MNARKILVPIFSRGNYAKLKNVILELNRSVNCEPIVVVGGTASLDKYGDLRQTMENNGITNFKTLNFVVTGEDLPAIPVLSLTRRRFRVRPLCRKFHRG